MVLSAIQFVLIALSYRSKVHSGKLVFTAFCLLIPRIGVRLLDFEQTETHLSEEDFRSSTTKLLLATYFTLFVCCNSIELTRFRQFIVVILQIFCYTCFTVENYGYDYLNDWKGYLRSILYYLIFLTYVFSNQ